VSLSQGEPYFGRAHLVKYFKVFGSKGYIKRHDENFKNVMLGILLRYASTKKSYRFYNLRLRKIFESAYVKANDIKTIGILVRDQ
jgi:hypothetical protein